MDETPGMGCPYVRGIHFSKCIPLLWLPAVTLQAPQKAGLLSLKEIFSTVFMP
jgi:hypothetical protein